MPAMSEVHFTYHTVDVEYFLAAGAACIILAAVGIALLAWIFKGKRRPSSLPQIAAARMTP
jgi:hypothetical protein